MRLGDRVEESGVIYIVVVAMGQTQRFAEDERRQRERVVCRLGDSNDHVVGRADEKQQTSKSWVCRSRSLLIIRAQSLSYIHKSVSTAWPASSQKTQIITML